MLLMTYLQKYLPSKTKDVNLKAFNMITRISEDTKMVNNGPVSCGWKCKFNSTTCNSNQKWNNDPCQCDRKNYRTYTKFIAGILNHVFLRMVSI